MSWESYNNYGNYDNPGYGYEDRSQQADQSQGGYDPTSYYQQPGYYNQGYNPSEYYPHGQQQEQQGQDYPGRNFMESHPVMTGMAMTYGEEFVGKGKEEIKRSLDKYVSLLTLRYYFAVDSTYVAKKLCTLLFPFRKTSWSPNYSEDGGAPLQPKLDPNAPDLYIPVMSYVTYILVVGYASGLRNAFTPDGLATSASSTLAWLLFEIGIFYLYTLIMNVSTNLSKWDILAFSSYKYVSTVLLCVIGLMGSRVIYYSALIYASIATSFFIARSLKLRIDPEKTGGGMPDNAKKVYALLFYSGIQPFFIWWLSFAHVLV